LFFYQAYGFDDDEEYDMDDGGDDGMIFSWDCISSLKNCNIRFILKVSQEFNVLVGNLTPLLTILRSVQVMWEPLILVISSRGV
jgi:hypothetical protein